jgi:hypothetical protein
MLRGAIVAACIGAVCALVVGQLMIWAWGR